MVEMGTFKEGDNEYRIDYNDKKNVNQFYLYNNEQGISSN
jgi:hypothetical protein